jgi:hypothetical protein
MESIKIKGRFFGVEVILEKLGVIGFETWSL